MTYREICAQLSDVGIDGAEWDAALLIEHFCGIDASLVPTDPTRDYPSVELFEAIRRLPENAIFADLCTGSGCIAISILAERRDTRTVAVEKFPATLSLAERNALRNRVSDRFTPRLGDVLTSSYLPEGQRFDAILSNPPYIETRVLSTLAPELNAEPLVALDGGEDGLLFYRAILTGCADKLKKGGFFLFEIGYDQAKSLSGIAHGLGFSGFRVLQDYGKNDRAVLITP